jgi:hypothetical protein
MSDDLGVRRAEIMAFLSGLSTREKLIVFTYLANDVGIVGRVSDLARVVLDVHRSRQRVKVLNLTSDGANVDLEFLARRKGCRLEAAGGPGDRWRVIPLPGRMGLVDRACSGAERDRLTRRQALALLRSLPDR